MGGASGGGLLESRLLEGDYVGDNVGKSSRNCLCLRGYEGPRLQLMWAISIDLRVYVGFVYGRAAPGARVGN